MELKINNLLVTLVKTRVSFHNNCKFQLEVIAKEKSVERILEIPFRNRSVKKQIQRPKIRCKEKVASEIFHVHTTSALNRVINDKKKKTRE